MRHLLALLVVLMPLASGAGTGTVRVIDGDTLVTGDVTIRLVNIDAPELGQTCGDDAPCGENAADALRSFLRLGALRCEGDETDAYDRRLGRCWVGDRDLGALMVATGNAVAFTRYSQEYVPQQLDAFKAGLGVWASDDFQMPWDYRAERWQRAGSTAPRADCPIKGNISRSGTRIYHMPYSRHYDRTAINEAAGERWFCDEAEARAAGWRPPYR